MTASQQDQQRNGRYDNNGNARQFIDAEGHSTCYSYDEQGNLRKQWSEVE
ncbi:MAG: RHS repeat domain-containing protein [Ketobacter sp.]|tara:strand:- start:309 stop:458 length:150 start_codon:yes stop_codon:yes gene_type:complete